MQALDGTIRLKPPHVHSQDSLGRDINTPRVDSKALIPYISLYLTSKLCSINNHECFALFLCACHPRLIPCHLFQMTDAHTAPTQFFASTSQPWGNKIISTALTLPDKYRDIALKGKLNIKYLQTGSTNTCQGEVPNKNHVILQAPFVEEGFEVDDLMKDIDKGQVLNFTLPHRVLEESL